MHTGEAGDSRRAVGDVFLLEAAALQERKDADIPVVGLDHQFLDAARAMHGFASEAAAAAFGHNHGAGRGELVSRTCPTRRGAGGMKKRGDAASGTQEEEETQHKPLQPMCHRFYSRQRERTFMQPASQSQAAGRRLPVLRSSSTRQSAEELRRLPERPRLEVDGRGRSYSFSRHSFRPKLGAGREESVKRKKKDQHVNERGKLYKGTQSRRFQTRLECCGHVFWFYGILWDRKRVGCQKNGEIIPKFYFARIFLNFFGAV